MTSRIDADEAELQALVGEGTPCAVTGCLNKKIDPRGPVYVTVDRREVQVGMCPPHWEGIFSTLGEQSYPEWTEEEDDAAYAEGGIDEGGPEGCMGDTESYEVEDPGDFDSEDDRERVLEFLRQAQADAIRDGDMYVIDDPTDAEIENYERGHEMLYGKEYDA